jgi:ankyrin repeat protein
VAALAGEHVETADLLHRNGADPHIQGPQLWTPLHSATYYGNLSVVQKLIKYGADISAEDLNGRTPFHLASEGFFLKDRSVLRLLLERGADINTRGKDGSTPLHFASRFRSLDVVRLLLDHGADVSTEDNSGRTPLQAAEQDQNVDVVKILLEHKVE